MPSPLRAALPLFMLACVVCTGCIAETLPPPPMPPASMPETTIPEPGPASGMARVVFTTDVPGRVERRFRVRSARHSAYAIEPVCSPTPCTVTMPYGDHELYFVASEDAARTSKETIHVLHPTEVINHTIGATTGISGLGIALLLVGSAIEGAGLGALLLDDGDGVGGVTLALLASGLALSTGGVVVMIASPPTEQPGATRQWSPNGPSPTPPTGGTSLGGRLILRF